MAKWFMNKLSGSEYYHLVASLSSREFLALMKDPTLARATRSLTANTTKVMQSTLNVSVSLRIQNTKNVQTSVWNYQTEILKCSKRCRVIANRRNQNAKNSKVKTIFCGKHLRLSAVTLCSTNEHIPIKTKTIEIGWESINKTLVIMRK